MEPRIVRGRPVGSDHVSRPRRRRERSAVCASPGCEEQAGEGRFCPAHQEFDEPSEQEGPSEAAGTV